MNLPNLRFSDFTSQSSYNVLKKNFLTKEDKYNIEEDMIAFAKSLSGENHKEINIEDNPHIKIKVQDISSNSEQTLNKEFFNDYLIPSIARMADNYYFKFKSDLEEKGIYEIKAMDSFAKEIISGLNEEENKIKRAEYLSSEIKESVLNQLAGLQDLLDHYLLDPYPAIKNKLQFNAKRTDVIYFFHLLRENGILEYLNDSDLGRIIDNVFEYKKNETFLKIENSRKHFNDFRKMAGRPEKPAINRLKKTFQDEDFYNV